MQNNFFQHGGNLSLVGCVAQKADGGGLQVVKGSFTLANGRATFVRCRASSGGGAAVGLSVHVGARASMTFDGCRAASGGAGGGQMAVAVGLGW